MKRSPNMHIAICSERFLFRFGADRVLILLARGLRELGHKVTLIGNRFDEEVVRPVSDKLIYAPTFEGADHIKSNELTATWISECGVLSGADRPDMLFVGGWPFFSAISLFRDLGMRAFFIDFGAVPLDGFSDGPLIVQQKLRELRRKHLRDATGIVAISDFILRTQSVPDSDGSVPSLAVLLGADHVDNPTWSRSEVSQNTSSGRALRTLEHLRRLGKKTVLNLGRWEPGCYKNSDEAFNVMRRVRSSSPDTVLLILAEPDIEVPADLRSVVHPIGFPDDSELTELMKRIDIGVSLSLWEGFNLPLAEMQWLDKVAFALNCGAHPEVVLDPWYLCENSSEMADKMVSQLRGEGLEAGRREHALARFRSTFQWDRMIEEYDRIVNSVTVDPVRVIVHVNNAAVDPANSGVIRITRRLSQQLQDTTPTLFVMWDSSINAYVLPTRQEFKQLGQFNGPLLISETHLSSDGAHRVKLEDAITRLGAVDPVLIVPETVGADRFSAIRSYARKLRLKIGVIFHDAIPVLRPDLCNAETRNGFAEYMRGLAECDFVMPVSDFSAESLKHFWRENGIKGTRVEVNLNPAEFAGSRRGLPSPGPSDPVSILCVSTLEPRKNHRRLIEACLLIQRNRPDLDWTLTLVGNRYAGAFEIAEWVESVAASNRRIRWLGIVDDATLLRSYQECSFTVYASLIEGFGMPIVESLWHARPCLCANQGVMAELAQGGGCLTTDVEDIGSLAASIAKLTEDVDLRRQLSIEAAQRELKSWADYVSRFHEIAFPPKTQSTLWTDTLYPGLRLNNWQMHDSERMMLTGLLSRVRPSCAIEVGTYFGGSLSLLAQYSKMVFSIDIDPDVPSRVGARPNVTHLIGDSKQILPIMFQELDRAGIPVNLILIDADHSEEGVRRDVSLVLQHRPKDAMFVLMHDSFNPNCRKGILDAPWRDSRYCHYLDVDFVPGRVVEHDGPSQKELWGGLALAFFLPEARKGPLTITQGAFSTFEACLAALLESRLLRGKGEGVVHAESISSY